MYLFYFQIEIIILIYIFPNIYENPPDYCTSKPKKIPIIINTHKHIQKSRACMYMQTHIEHDHKKKILKFCTRPQQQNHRA